MEIFLGFMPYSQFLLSQTVENQVPIPPEQFACNHCADRFSTQRGLEIHVNKMHYNHPKTSVCTVCFKSFKNKYLLHTHNKQVHCKVLRVECVKCEKFFSSKFTLQKHLKKKHQTVVNIN